MPKLAFGRANVALAMLPAWLIVIVGFFGSTIWTFVISLTNSKLLPVYDFNMFEQYQRLLRLSAWRVAVENLAVFGVLFILICLVLGFVMAVMMDQRIRGESLFRTIFLYPYAMSFVVTGLVWQWVLNPSFGIQAAVRGLGFDGFVFDWIVNPDRAIFVVVLAAVWHGSGLVMAIPAGWAARGGRRPVEGHAHRRYRQMAGLHVHCPADHCPHGGHGDSAALHFRRESL